MNSINILLLNFKETRRRSINVWKGIPSEYLHWKPDAKAMSCIEMIRHVLEGEHLFHTIIKNRGNLGDYKSPWKDLAFIDVDHELQFAESYKTELYTMIEQLSENDLKDIVIHRQEVNQVKELGDYLNRMVYHEAVHTGQLLSYLRTLRIKRPQVWD
ncbi:MULTISPECIES: DinB family protein [unclassified Tenacibaculum]|uniref:DinB family protein n=1 Tax=unclassified Tenacibaculum TaxID=2635139 RepID=UPI001F1A80B0|nr:MULTISPECIES: DinB family protein [unclassified Tenacibaculum]MCF2876049.1 DinB family protein [Tenacibaculum sp. Cn5-1]MCF2936124.1 DinB family protein [Tenacibaculum sp. Cn5-34]MCG7512685.1 DinB family protein [Tenacibaculum sp. Cn5-46]